MEHHAPSNWDRFKLLLWKNWRVYFSQKSSMFWEIFPAFLIGFALLFFRGLLREPHFSQEKIYPDFSPAFLPLGRVPDIDSVFHLNRSSHKVFPVAESICEIVRRGQADPGKLSIRSISNILHKLKDMNPSQIDFKRPEIVTLLNTINLRSILPFLSSKLINEDVRDMMQFLIELNSGEDSLVETVTDILQSRRDDIVSKLQELKKKSESPDAGLKRWIVLWSPVRNKVLASIMNEAATITPFITCGLENSSLLLDALTRPLPYSQEYYTLAGVNFPDSLQEASDLPEHLPITLRFPGLPRFTYDPKAHATTEAYQSDLRLNWETIRLFPKEPVPGPRNPNEIDGGAPGYYREGFLGLQSSISEAITRHYNESTGGKMPPLRIRLQRFPDPPTYNDPDGAFMLLIVTLSSNAFLAAVIATTRRIVSEKETHFKEILRIVGVQRWLQWAAWFFPALLEFIVISAFLVLIFKVTIHGRTVFPSSDSLYVFGVLIMCSVQTVTFCFILSTFFSSATNASAGAGGMWVLLNIVYGQCELRSIKLSYNARFLLSCVPNCNILYTFRTIWSLESTGQGLNWDTLDYTLSDSNDIAISTLLQIVTLESIFFIIGAMYWETVNPGPLGIPLPWYFPFTRRFWFGGRKQPYVERGNNEENLFLEPDPENLPAGIQIRGLRKIYRNGKVAVQSLTLNMYEGQITVLLAPNGGGKTTTLSMLTGMLAPTAGTAEIANHDLVLNPQAVRKNLGVCPQGNLLLDDLTVNEHLYFFCKLKGLSQDAVDVEASKYIKCLQLESKANVASKFLSGGMKRKLGTALALCGGTKVVLLDEPTSGMDPTARRALWDLLKAEKTGRTILLTTHFMDEADCLGDRIAIIMEGRLRAVGSSFALKKKFSGGYRLVLVKNPGCKSNEITKLVQNFQPGIEPLSDVGSELSFQLPENKAFEFPSLFQALEQNRDNYGINSFGITSASIDEVFMNVIANSRRRVSTKTEQGKSQEYSNETCVPLGIEPPLTGISLLFSQFQALMTKHWIIFAKTPLVHTLALLCPALNAIFTMVTTAHWQGTEDPLPRTFSLKDYNDGYAAIFGKNNSIMENFGKIVEIDGGILKNLSGSDSVETLLEHIRENDLTAQTNFITAMDVEPDTIKGFFNNKAYHSAPLVLQYAYNSFLTANGVNLRLDFVNHPLPFTGVMKSLLQQNCMNTSFHLAYQGSIIFLMLAAWLLVSHVREKKSGSKLLQLMAGVNPVFYWLVAFIWDIIYCIIAVLFFVWVPYLYQEEGYSTIEDASKLFVVAFSFFTVVIVICFLFSLLDVEPAKSFLYFSMLGYNFGGFYFIILAGIKLNKLLSPSSIEWWRDTLTWSPFFSIAESIQNVNQFYWLKTFCEPINQKFCVLENVKHICCKDPLHCPEEGCKYWTDDFLDMKPPGVGNQLWINLLIVVSGSVLLVLIEAHMFQKIKLYLRKSVALKWQPVDEDVYREWQLVQSILPSQRKSCNLLVSELSKKYGNIEAVKNLSLLIPAGECFGLLGVNGAGKTTTFRMLTGDLEPSSGDAFVNGFSLRYHRKQVHQLIGYCPQFDGLLDEFTGRETLRLFCKLRGIPETEVELTCEKLARDLLFYPYIDHPVKTYSGGNKRKLSTAVALVGDPPVIFLDEPTTGMDPVAKRYFWEVISTLRNSGKTIILTSHSMEECEALCTRVGIMVSGELLCLGSPQHLKTKFAQGYCLTVKISSSQRKKYVDSKNILDFIQDRLRGAVLNEQHDGVYTFHIAANSSSWSEMFQTLETARSKDQIEDYYLGQTSLEEVFLSIAARDEKTD